jgi:4-amino-4-deoxy-L-arabinose transferase-like glycosyltransferase
MRARAFDTVVLGGLTAGFLDLLDAFMLAILNGVAPVRVLHAIASGVLGREAYQGGAPAAALGLGLHFVIASAAATAYFLASRKLTVLLRRPVVCGLAFGLAVWAFMYYVVLPITFNRPNAIPAWPMLVNQLGIHALGVGLPIALFAARSARRAGHKSFVRNSGRSPAPVGGTR